MAYVSTDNATQTQEFTPTWKFLELRIYWARLDTGLPTSSKIIQEGQKYVNSENADYLSIFKNQQPQLRHHIQQ